MFVCTFVDTTPHFHIRRDIHTETRVFTERERNTHIYIHTETYSPLAKRDACSCAHSVDTTPTSGWRDTSRAAAASPARGRRTGPDGSKTGVRAPCTTVLRKVLTFLNFDKHPTDGKTIVVGIFVLPLFSFLASSFVYYCAVLLCVVMSRRQLPPGTHGFHSYPFLLFFSL